MIMAGITKASVLAFNERRLDVQYEIYGQAGIYIAKKNTPEISVTVCHSAVRNNKELRDGGFALLHDFIGKIRKSALACAPLEEGSLTLVMGGKTYRIKEVVNHPLSGEWKLGLRTAT